MHTPRRSLLAVRYVATLLLSVVALHACRGQPGPTGTTFRAGHTRVLFIGNSLTYVQDVPALVLALARQHGDTAWRANSVAYADFALEDHWYEGTARRLLADGDWEFVVMQQGPSSLPANQRHLASWSQQFEPLIRAAGAQPVLYQVWPNISRQGDFPNTRTAYANAAMSVNGLFAPAGSAWEALLASHPEVSLYSGDGLHATRTGAYVAALVIYGRLSGVDPRSLPDAIPGQSGTTAASVQVLQDAAFAALSGDAAFNASIRR